MSMKNILMNPRKYMVLRDAVINKVAVSQMCTQIREIPLDVCRTETIGLKYKNIQGQLIYLYLYDELWYGRLNKNATPFMREEHLSALINNHDEWLEVIQFDKVLENSQLLSEKWVEFALTLSLSTLDDFPYLNAEDSPSFFRLWRNHVQVLSKQREFISNAARTLGHDIYKVNSAEVVPQVENELKKLSSSVNFKWQL